MLSKIEFQMKSENSQITLTTINKFESTIIIINNERNNKYSSMLCSDFINRSDKRTACEFSVHISTFNGTAMLCQ